MTIHITPEAEFSYVSFESNIPQSSYMDVIARVLETFRPGKFIVTSFANKVIVLGSGTTAACYQILCLLLKCRAGIRIGIRIPKLLDVTALNANISCAAHIYSPYNNLW